MQFAILADIHSNLAAFEAVLEDLEKRGGFDKIWCLGDIVGYGPEPNACIKLLRQFDHSCVAGNHDWAANLRKNSRRFVGGADDIDDISDSPSPRGINPFNTISRSVALSMRNRRGWDLGGRESRSFHMGMGANDGPTLPRRFLRPDELERRFNKRFRTLSRRYRDFPLAQQNMDIEVIDI